MAEFSRDELANKLGVSERTVRRVESGVTYPRAGLAERWLKACKMSIAVSIVGASGGRSKPQ
jgi:transcriptional regulator with XRE-family HTH domain